MNFWEKLEKPFFMLAPLADVTDPAFRRIVAKYGKPSVIYTEFVSADGLLLADEKGKEILKKDLLYTESERPIVAQFFTGKPVNMEGAVKLAVELGFDGVDINMGCPDRSVEKQGAGAGLIKDSRRAKEIIKSAKRGAGGLPVSVKTRIGYNKNEIEEWLPELLSEEPATIVLHARTRKEMSKVPAHWEVIKRAVKIRDELKSGTLIVGNGDAADLVHAKKLAEESGADGVMLGRAIFGNPWLFSGEIPSIEEKLKVMVEHTKLFEELLPHKNFAVMKKHYKAYVNGFDGAKELRNRLFEETSNATEVENIIGEYLKSS
ncbi:MAG: tRNA-dihydrouridine synthase [Candidatus Pacebacteria bacterium]|jgi:nifR3 family TIM-barrel protein|nr:tRNA-dihydrouridine synthase [bacterium]MDP6527848.1 tRNA-dihydrouridine synthase [Candidatus Paceibacterota bacterium]MDP6659797.1 tRNA-dihydrouridine synthase [Candidatus Paceibacterota bacterium]|tara:strand:+ start:10971 stop:11927 length:957 start_codon:yes stop_codon:yes gene_type:complete